MANDNLALKLSRKPVLVGRPPRFHADPTVPKRRSFNLSDEDFKRVRRAAVELGESPSAVIRRLIRRCIDAAGQLLPILLLLWS